MRAFLNRYRPHIGLMIGRAVALVLFTLAGVTLAGVYFTFLLAVGLGATAGIVVGLLIDQAAVAYGRRMEHLDMAEHLERQAESRRRRGEEPGGTTDPERQAQTRHNAARTMPTIPGRGGALGVLGAGLAASTFAQLHRVVTGPDVAARAAAHGLVVVDQGAGGASLDEATEIRQLRDLMLGELTAQDLVGQQGRGVIQLAAELGPRVPLLDPETVVAYVSDHVLVAAGQQPEHPQRWHGALDTVTALADPTGGRGAAVTDSHLLGIDQAADGRDPAPWLDLVVSVLSNSGIGLGLTQLGVALGAKDMRVGPYTLAVLLKLLVDQGRLVQPDGEARYRLSRAEWAARSAGATSTAPSSPPRPPLDVVYSVLAAAGEDGMTPGLVAGEVERRREIPCTAPQAAAALDALVAAGRATLTAERFVAVTHDSLLSGPGLRQRIMDAVTGAGEAGLTVAEIVEAVNADGFGTPDTEVVAMIAAKITRHELWRSPGDGRIQLPPF